MPMPTKFSPREISNAVGRLSGPIQTSKNNITMAFTICCLLYTSDAADE